MPGLGEKKLRAISIGRTVSYTERARWISPYASPRPVANACGANPIALAMRCDGDPAGYRWGIERKREMIRREALA